MEWYLRKDKHNGTEMGEVDKEGGAERERQKDKDKKGVT